MYVNLNKGPDGFIGSRETESHEKAMEIAKPLTPKSERGRSTYGSLLTSMQTVQGLCPERKCIKREGHSGSCWPLP